MTSEGLSELGLIKPEVGSGLSNLSLLLGTSTEAEEELDLASHHMAFCFINIYTHQSLHLPSFSKGFNSLACGQAIISLKLAQMSKIFHFLQTTCF